MTGPKTPNPGAVRIAPRGTPATIVANAIKWCCLHCQALTWNHLRSCSHCGEPR